MVFLGEQRSVRSLTAYIVGFCYPTAPGVSRAPTLLEKCASHFDSTYIPQRKNPTPLFTHCVSSLTRTHSLRSIKDSFSDLNFRSEKVQNSSHYLVRSVGTVLLHTPPRRARSSKHTHVRSLLYYSRFSFVVQYHLEPSRVDLQARDRSIGTPSCSGSFQLFPRVCP